MLTLDLRDCKSTFGDWIDAWDRFVKEHGKAPEQIIITSEDMEAIYPHNGFYSKGPRHWRDIPLIVKEKKQ